MLLIGGWSTKATHFCGNVYPGYAKSYNSTRRRSAFYDGREKECVKDGGKKDGYRTWAIASLKERHKCQWTRERMFSPGKMQIKSTLFSSGLKLKEIYFPERWDERCVPLWMAGWFSVFFFYDFFFFKDKVGEDVGERTSVCCWWVTRCNGSWRQLKYNLYKLAIPHLDI